VPIEHTQRYLSMDRSTCRPCCKRRNQWAQTPPTSLARPLSLHPFTRGYAVTSSAVLGLSALRKGEIPCRLGGGETEGCRGHDHGHQPKQRAGCLPTLLYSLGEGSLPRSCSAAESGTSSAFRVSVVTCVSPLACLRVAVRVLGVQAAN